MMRTRTSSEGRFLLILVRCDVVIPIPMITLLVVLQYGNLYQCIYRTPSILCSQSYVLRISNFRGCVLDVVGVRVVLVLMSFFFIVIITHGAGVVWGRPPIMTSNEVPLRLARYFGSLRCISMEVVRYTSVQLC